MLRFVLINSVLLNLSFVWIQLLQFLSSVCMSFTTPSISETRTPMRGGRYMAQVGDVFNQVLRFRDDSARFSMRGILHQDFACRGCLSKIFHSRNISIRFSVSGMFQEGVSCWGYFCKTFFFISGIFLQDFLYRGYFFKIFHVGDVSARFSMLRNISTRFFHSGMFLKMFIAGRGCFKKIAFMSVTFRQDFPF